MVFREAIEAVLPFYEVHLFTATPSGDGFLNNIPSVKMHPLVYKWSPNKFRTLHFFVSSQLKLCMRLLRFLKKNDTVYINTLLPFGATIAAKIKGCRIICHVHEVSLKPAPLKRFLVSIAERSAQKILFVSKYVAAQYQFKKPVTEVIYNALPESFTSRIAGAKNPQEKAQFTVLMLCSLKAYKGIYHFISIAKALPHFRFELVLNTSQADFEHFCNTTVVPENCTLFPAQKDTLPFYQRASVVMNLSKPESWIETFGMTLLEAMAFGIPVIAPNVGGPVEVVENGVEGYNINSENESAIIQALKNLYSDAALYQNKSIAAKLKAASFTASSFTNHIQKSLQPIATARS